MYKENGRTGTSERKEKASKVGKTFKCPNCGEEKLVLNVEFGVNTACDECHSIMVEKDV